VPWATSSLSKLASAFWRENGTWLVRATISSTATHAEECPPALAQSSITFGLLGEAVQYAIFEAAS
jgi:hypothetical protein